MAKAYIKDEESNEDFSSEEETNSRIIVKNAVKRKPGYLYYVDGNGSLCEAKMARISHEVEETSNEEMNDKHIEEKIKKKKFSTALLLSIFLGWLGIDRFYLGGTANITIGLIKMFTLGLCGIWWIIDIIFIANKKLKNID